MPQMMPYKYTGFVHIIDDIKPTYVIFGKVLIIGYYISKNGGSVEGTIDAK